MCIFFMFSKDPRGSKLFRAKRSEQCNEIEKLTLKKTLEFKGFDWSKNVGNDAIGASFGVKAVNYAHMELCK